MHTGSFGEVATYLPGRRVEGVRLTVDLTEVHVVVAADVDLRTVAHEVRGATSPLVRGSVDVFIEDLELSTVPGDVG